MSTSRRFNVFLFLCNQETDNLSPVLFTLSNFAPFLTSCLIWWNFSTWKCELFFSGCVEVHRTCFCLCTILFMCFPSDLFSLIHPWISVWYGGFIFLSMFWWLNPWRSAVVTPSFTSAGPLTFYLNLLMWFLLDSLTLSSMFPVHLALAPPTHTFWGVLASTAGVMSCRKLPLISYTIKHFIMPQYAKSCVFAVNVWWLVSDNNQMMIVIWLVWIK